MSFHQPMHKWDTPRQRLWECKRSILYVKILIDDPVDVQQWSMCNAKFNSKRGKRRVERLLSGPTLTCSHLRMPECLGPQERRNTAVFNLFFSFLLLLNELTQFHYTLPSHDSFASIYTLPKPKCVAPIYNLFSVTERGTQYSGPVLLRILQAVNLLAFLF